MGQGGVCSNLTYPKIMEDRPRWNSTLPMVGKGVLSHLAQLGIMGHLQRRTSAQAWIRGAFALT
jgi:hypothetical protein